MTEDRSWIDDVPIPALLRAARGAYSAAVIEALADAGCDDVPRNGTYVIGAIARSGAPLSQIVKELGVSKQAAGQLVDTLVLRGYLNRSVDSQDRRRLTVTLTGRGVEAAKATRAAIERVDSALIARIGPQYVSHARIALAALFELGRETTGESD